MVSHSGLTLDRRDLMVSHSGITFGTLWPGGTLWPVIMALH